MPRACAPAAGARIKDPPRALESNFMSKTMLIDAAHPEETRVVVLNGNQVEAFDFESRAKKQLRGNIYLAKVTRVEPSLQAAFVEYGGNRHGFLAFNEIHPDYYQIPHADREALMREAEEEDDDHSPAPTQANGDGDDAENLAAMMRTRSMKRWPVDAGASCAATRSRR